MIAGQARTLTLFVANGLAATAVNFATLLLLVEVARLPSVGAASALASVVGTLASYLGNRGLVFRSSASVRQSLPRFLALYATIALLQGLVMFLWSDVGRLPYTLGFIGATGLATLASYFGNRHFVFPDRDR